MTLYKIELFNPSARDGKVVSELCYCSVTNSYEFKHPSEQANSDCPKPFSSQIDAEIFIFEQEYACHYGDDAVKVVSY